MSQPGGRANPLQWRERQSARLRSAGRSDVAAILKLAEEPDVISFAGGLPDPRTYLLDEVAQVAGEVVATAGKTALGYGPTPGIAAMREWLAQHMSERGRRSSPAEILVTTGGIAALDLIARALVDPGDTVIVGEPTYLAALQLFRSYQARIAGAAVDAEGMVPEALEGALADLAGERITPKLIYLVPSFQNPSGVTLSAERRQRILDVAARHGVPVVEDGAYDDLRFEGQAEPLMAALDPERVIHINTFSKIFNPGVRLGWVAASEPLIDLLVVAKLAQDQCSSTIAQHLCVEFARRGHLEAQIARAREIYRDKRDITLAALAARMPQGTRWTEPAGGFYIWLTVPEGVDSDALLATAVARERVAYVPGPAFFHDGTGQRQLRLCYSYVAGDAIDDGIARLARLIADRAGS